MYITTSFDKYIVFLKLYDCNYIKYKTSDLLINKKNI